MIRWIKSQKLLLSKVDKTESKTPNNKKLIRYFLLVLLGGLGFAWLINTPPGLLGKSDAIAYAVCHRIGSHSHYFGDRPFSLCARCSGQYLGFIWGFGFQFLVSKKRSGFPSRGALAVMAALFVLFLVDGLNSAVYQYPGLDHLSLYQPSNLLRLFSGLGFGIVVSAVLYPLAGQTVWSETSLLPSIRGYKDWMILIGGAIGIGLLILTENPLLTYPLILTSTGSLMLLLTVLYTVIWILLRKRENSFSSWKELIWWGIAGFTSALMQIAFIDLIRFLLTGTWSGFPEY